ncbi:MAG: hypothetical protein HUJ53_06125 [Holdemanella sp.]|nr:hypothetical protein [Holdemanella sp.]
MTLQEFLLDRYDRGFLKRLSEINVEHNIYVTGFTITSPDQERIYYEKLDDNFFMKQLKNCRVESAALFYEDDGKEVVEDMDILLTGDIDEKAIEEWMKSNPSKVTKVES